MALKQHMSKAEIKRFFADRLRAFDEAVLANLQYLGEQCVNKARLSGSYTDQTGNLRASVGYVIAQNGRVIQKSFEGQAKGRQTGEGYARSLANQYPTGWVLIVVAGMNYAAQVESRGRDVLTSAEQLAQTELPRMLAELKADFTDSL